MKISSLFGTGRPVFSFEFFPPKDVAAEKNLFDTLADLKTFRPDFVSVTYGAGGSTRAKTVDIVSRIKKDVGIEPVAHLTCVGHSKDDIAAVLNDLSAHGIENILALRGDPPKGQTDFKPHPHGYHHANELAEAIAQTKRFCFGVAGYPEKHPDAPSLETDLVNLKRKVGAGASFVTTQLFFVNGYYFDFVARARALGIRVPIIPGIMPITNVAQIQRFASMCGARLPEALVAELTAVQDDAAAVARIGIRYATEQCQELLQKGAPGIHFYTLNKSHATREILSRLQSFRHTPKTPLLTDI